MLKHKEIKINSMLNIKHKREVGKLGETTFEMKSIGEFHTEDFLDFRNERVKNVRLVYDIEVPIIDETEKKYLASVIRPFREKVLSISKEGLGEDLEYITIEIQDDNAIDLPNFAVGTMYKGMKLYKQYKLKDLGL